MNYRRRKQLDLQDSRVIYNQRYNLPTVRENGLYLLK
jgi:hypothetical protein